MKPYVASFEVGSSVWIAELPKLQEFRGNWRYHNPLQEEQLAFAGRTARVSKVGFYHGGDPLYVLEDLPGVWHEECLRSLD
jgi:hypothetical protein